MGRELPQRETLSPSQVIPSGQVGPAFLVPWVERRQRSQSTALGDRRSGSGNMRHRLVFLGNPARWSTNRSANRTDT